LQTQPGSSGGLLADKLFAAQSEIIKKKLLLRPVYNRKKVLTKGKGDIGFCYTSACI